MRRLLLKKSASQEAEKIMISKLRTECGDVFTKKAEGMMRDLSESNEFMKEYLKVKGENPEGIETTFSVLSNSSWPISAVLKCNMPPQLERIQETFTQYYVGRHSGRCLQWCIQMGTCVIQGRFNEGVTRQMEMSAPQAVVLMQFASKECLSFDQLKESTGLEADELKKQLVSLVCMEHRPLTKHQ